MQQAQLIEAVSSHSVEFYSAGISKTIVKAVLDSLGDIATAELVKGGEITVPGLGKLSVTQRAARTGRNPATGDEIRIPAKKAVKFGAAKALKDALNPVPAKKGKK